MASKRYLEILETVKKNNPEFYQKLMDQEKGKQVEASRAPTPKAKSDPSGPGPTLDADYIGLLKAFKAAHPKATAFEALKAIDKIAPLARQKFVKKQAAGEQPDPGAYSGTVDPLDFKKLVSKYQREHKCTIAEAWKMIEQDHPGLRAEYIRKINQ